MATDKQEAFYTEQLALHGPNYKGVAWGSAPTQELRFRVLLDGLTRRARQETLLDVGCGYGAFSEHVRKATSGSVHYEGWDVTPGMVEAAQKQYPFGGLFRVKDIVNSDPGLRKYDWVTASGLFAHGDFSFFSRATQIMWAMAERGLLFNSLSTWGEHSEPGEFQLDPVQALIFCRKQLGGRIVMRLDYLPHDVSIYVYR